MGHSFLVAHSPSSLQISIFPNCKLLSLQNQSKFRPSSSSFASYSNSLSFRIFTTAPSRFLHQNCSFKCSLTDSDTKTAPIPSDVLSEPPGEFTAEVRNAAFPSNLLPPKLSLSDRAFFLLTFIACTTAVAFVGLVSVAVPTLFAMGRAAIALAKLADTAREELPGTMAAIRLSGMEISDLSLELRDLSQEIADGVNKSAQAVQAAEAGVRKIGSLAQQQTMSMIEERANLPDISLQPFVAGAAKKTSRAVGRATKTLMKIISGAKLSSSQYEDGNAVDRFEV